MGCVCMHVFWFNVLSCVVFINPLSPSIHIQILQTDLHTFPLRISWENLIKDQGIFFLGDHFINSHNLSVDSVWILLGENWSWSLLGLKGLNCSWSCELLLFVAFLPSTFAMYMVLLSYGGWFAGNYVVSLIFTFHLHNELIPWYYSSLVKSN